MQLDRASAYGYRLNIGAGTAVRFEPGVSRTIEAVEIGGQGVIKGGNNLAAVVNQGKIDQSRAKEVGAEAVRRGFAHKDSAEVALPSPLLSLKFLTRQVYASMYGPTTGDRLRVGDTNLILEVEWDACALVGGYGDELKFGGGKVLRDGMGQMSGASEQEALDLCISNVIVLDVSGCYKADIGIKNGRIVGIGKAGNPHTMRIHPPNMIFGVNTDSIDASGMIITAGAIDSHVHFICPQLLDEALASGVTTVIGGGCGPTSGTNATTCTPNSHAVRNMLESTDSYPINVGLTGKGNSSSPEGLAEQLRAGCIGLKLHEDWGTTPATIDACLREAEAHDVQVTIHTDTLNEGGSCPQTLAAIGQRTIHFYHVEGAGGGHAPDILTACSHPNVIPSSTNPTRPYTRNTVDEHVDMLMVCHHLDPRLPEDVCFAESRIRAETIAAEDLLHDLGAISIISSDSQAMGRAGEVITRTWQTAHKMKAQRGQLQADHTEVRGKNKEETGARTVLAAASAAPSPSVSSSSASTAASSSSWQTGHDNFRLRRYVAKYTCNPALAHGISHVVGSVSVGLLADLVLWAPALFGRAPEIVLKGGVIVRAQMGDASASIPTPQPRLSRPMFGAMGGAPAGNSVVFVSQASIQTNSLAQYKIHKRVEAVKGCRTVQKKVKQQNRSRRGQRERPAEERRAHGCRCLFVRCSLCRTCFSTAPLLPSPSIRTHTASQQMESISHASQHTSCHSQTDSLDCSNATQPARSLAVPLWLLSRSPCCRFVQTRQTPRTLSLVRILCFDQINPLLAAQFFIFDFALLGL